MRDHAAPEWDYSGLHDREVFLSFQAAADYCLTSSDNSNAGDYDPTWECFVIELVEQDPDGATNAACAAADTPAAPSTSKPATSANSGLLQARLAQLQELEAKYEEERRKTQKLRATLEVERAERGAGTREAGRIARDRSMADDDVDNLLVLNRGS